MVLRQFSPRATVLDWLREDMGAKGTKEGCAEGDCGACTVVLARLKEGRLTYEPFNACILLLGQLDGAELITVEDLAVGAELHPVQRAMVDHHASQCGFCTPGIVMSLFAALPFGRAAGRYAGLCDQLAGNLCRCTGYRPILAAALETCSGAPADRFAATSQERADALSALADQRDVFVGDEEAFFAAPASLDSLAALYARFPDATLVGGATDVGLWVTKQLRRPEARDLARQGGWAGRCRRERRRRRAFARSGRHTGGRYAAPRRDLRRFRRVAASFRIEAGAGEWNGRWKHRQRVADRRSGASPDRARRQGGAAQGRQDARLPLEDFFIAYGKQDREPGEFVVAVEAPRLAPHQRYRAFKVSKRFDEDISAVMLAARFDLDGRKIASARVACGGMAATPKRAAKAERALVGASLDEPATWRFAREAIGEDFTPLTDMRATAAYRKTVAANLLEKTLIEISGASAPTRIGMLACRRVMT